MHNVKTTVEKTRSSTRRGGPKSRAGSSLCSAIEAESEPAATSTVTGGATITGKGEVFFSGCIEGIVDPADDQVSVESTGRPTTSW